MARKPDPAKYNTGERKKINGCGPWWVPDLFKDEYFYDQCAVHDIDYYDDKKCRKVADKAFLKTMISRIKCDEKIGWWTKRARRAQAYFFYTTVRIFGWSSHVKGLDL